MAKDTMHKARGPILEVIQRLAKNKAAMIGLAIVVLLIVTALTAPLFYDYEKDVIKQNIPERNQSPSLKHLFGTDELGRDLFTRIIYGSRVSLSIGFSSVAVAFLIGGFLGAIAGYFGGWLDNIIMRFMDIFLAIPGTLFAITIAAALGDSIRNLIIALAISSIPGFARILRSSVITVRDVEFIEAARAIGASDGRIILNHVIPNALAPVIVHTTLNVATIILTIAGLSFLGLGIAPPRPEWGQIISDGRSAIMVYPHIAASAGFAIMITILALNLLGDGLRDALDPRLK